MNINKQQVDDLNLVVSITIEKEDYAANVEKAIGDYRKNAVVPGFRKGHVPANMIRKQYGRAIKLDEINKQLQDNLYLYLNREKLNFLGNPLPKEGQTVDFDADDITFQFEVGLAPTFEVNLQPSTPIVRYEIVVDDAQIDQQVARIQKQFGKLVSKGEVMDGDSVEVTGTFFNEEKGIDSQATFSLETLSDDARKVFVGKKIGDQFQLQTKGLFQDAHSLMHYLKVSHDEAHHLEVEVTFTLEEVNERESAVLDQELFNKLFPDGSVTSEEQLREKIREGAQQQYNEQADQHFLNTVTDYLIDNTQFELPAEFLKRWLRTTTEKELTQEEANEEYNRSERGLRYQLIEGKLLADNKLETTSKEIEDFAHEYVKAQLAQYGMPLDDSSYVEGIVERVLKNREEVQRIQQQLVFKKLIAFYKENVNLEVKKVSFDEFVKIAFPE
nr:trigger factor [uncultured Capnocytophaga sp.]